MHHIKKLWISCTVAGLCAKRSCDKSKFTLLIFLSKTLLWKHCSRKVTKLIKY